MRARSALTPVRGDSYGRERFRRCRQDHVSDRHHPTHMAVRAIHQNCRVLFLGLGSVTRRPLRDFLRRSGV